MKLLIISNMYPSIKDPVYGTFVQSFVENISELNKDGITDKVVLKGRDGYLVYKIWKYLKFYICSFFRLLYFNYDIIYVHTITYPIIPIRIVSLFKNMPIVFNVHGADVLTRGKVAATLKEIAKPLLVKAKLIVSPSYYFKEVLLKEFPFLINEKIFISQSSGINNSFYIDKKNTKNEVFTIGFVSRIDYAKGWDTFLKALFILINRNIKIQAVIAGRGAQINDMLNMIDKLSLDSYVKYLGPIPYKKLPDTYSTFDIFIFPTLLEESLGLVGLEAMACKIPVIGSKIGGLQDYIIPNYNGYLFTPNNEVELADKIEYYFYLDHKKKKILQNNAYQTALQYKSEIINLELYKKLIKICNNE